MCFWDELRHVLYRVFWSFAQMEHAFQFYRPVVLVDGTFLTGKYKGTLMMAVAVDAEDQIVPMCKVEMADQRGGEQSFVKLIASANRNKCGNTTIGLAKTTPLNICSIAPCKDTNKATKVPGQLELS